MLFYPTPTLAPPYTDTYIRPGRNLLQSSVSLTKPLLYSHPGDITTNHLLNYQVSEVIVWQIEWIGSVNTYRNKDEALLRFRNFLNCGYNVKSKTYF